MTTETRTSLPDHAVVPAVWGRITNLDIDRGEGSWLITRDGERYRDYSSGIGVTNTGHAHPRVAAAIAAQAQKLLHGQQNILYHEPGLRLYEERLRFVSPQMRVTLTFPSPYLRHFPTPLLIEHMDGSEVVAEQRTVSYEEAFRAELHHFHAAIAEGRPAAPSIDDALGDARWIQQIAEAYEGE